MKLIAALLCSFLAFAVSCDSTANVDKHAIVKNAVYGQLEKIVLIFSGKPPVKNKYSFKNGITFETSEPETIYFDKSSSIGTSFLPRANDTITILPKSNFIVIKQRLDPYNYTEHILQSGDTAVFTYIENYPNLIIKNKPESSGVRIYEKSYKTKFLKKLLTPVVMYSNADMFIDWSISLTHIRAQLKKYKATAYASSMIFLNREDKLLDSLSATKLLLHNEYIFYKMKNKYSMYLIKMKEGKSSMNDIMLLANDTSTDYNYLPAAYRRHLIEAATDKFIVAKAKYMDLKDGINRDYRQSYDLIKGTSEFSKADKNWLLTREMRRIADTFSANDFHRYYTRYAQDVPDTSMVNTLRRDYALRFDAKNSDVQSVVLMKSNGKQLTLETLKKLYAGKVVYVDFWASWCGPCREALPYSVELRDKLKGKNVVFVYLSIDNTLKSWQTASTQETLSSHEDNYLIVNHSTSNFLKQQKLTSIPRYMIFDKQGKLAYPNAPGAKSKNLPALLIGLAK